MNRGRMRATPCRVLKAIFLISFLSFLITGLNFLLSNEDDFEILYNQDVFNGEYKESLYNNADENSDDHLRWEQEEEERKRMMDQLYHLSAKSENGSHAEFLGNLTLPDVKKIIWQKNRDQVIRNLEKFELSGSESTIVVVVQVHNRPEYLRHLVRSLSKARDIEKTLVIFSHDFYSDELNKIVLSIDFCLVMQIYYPFSMQLHPNVFPGEDPTDCPRDINKEKAMVMNCSNKDYPDRYGHYREAKYCQTKHHWFWKINHVFDYLDVTKNFEGPVLLIEEDHYLVEDFVPVLRQMHRLKRRSCTDCNIITLGTYDKKPAYGSLSPQVDVSTFASSRHNMGMSLTRKTWNEIKKCGPEFCRYDDYNWDWSMNNIGTACTESKLKVMLMKSPRIYHIGECGLHAKGRNCNPLDRVSNIEKLLKDNAEFLFPARIYVGGYPTIPRRVSKPNGGWGDLRDHQLCISFLDAESHL